MDSQPYVHQTKELNNYSYLKKEEEEETINEINEIRKGILTPNPPHPVSCGGARCRSPLNSSTSLAFPISVNGLGISALESLY